MEFTVIRYDDELYHYGVKGMKWGVRRYQKEDGSLTSAGVTSRKYYEAVKESIIKLRIGGKNGNTKQ